MTFGKQTSSTTVLITILLGVGLQGCSSSPVVKQDLKNSNKPSASSLRLSDADTAKLFQKGTSDYLRNISQGFNTLSQKPILVSQSPLLRQAILSSGRGKALAACQFPALRIELDGKKDTADWLVTTKGKSARCAADSRYFWIIQQGKSSPAEILLASRGSFVKVKPTGSGWSEVEVEGSAMIPIKSGDKLSNGSWLQVPSKDNRRVQISCKNKLRLQGKRYQSYAESVEANVVSLPFPGKTWQPVNDPRYRCSF